MTTFVVDDDPVISQFVAATLEQQGFSVMTANSGPEAKRFGDRSIVKKIF
jgi:DNA-binding response OmpR family regulator